MHRSVRLTWDLPLFGGQCPFLYQTSTILRVNQRALGTRTQSITTSCLRRGQKDVFQNDRDIVGHRSFLKEKAAQVNSNRRSGLGPSITPSEQEAFDSILTLFEEPASRPTGQAPTSVDHTDTNYKNILELFASLPQPSRKALPVTDDEGTRGHESFQGYDSTQKDIDDNPHLLSTRESLKPQSPKRVTREAAMTEIQEFLTDTAPAESSTQSAETVESVALQIVQDVADSLTSALQSTNPGPEVAMWRVAEQKIFPLIQLLRPSTSTLSSPAPSIESDSPLQQHPLVPSTVPLLPLLTLAYPSLTLLLIRLYRTHHPISPYALSLLPTLKSLGPTSYVLGANTHFYNTLLSLQWAVYSSLRGMAGLLAEMEANGVDFDLGTWNVLKTVERDMEQDTNGAGERGAMWWDRTEQRVWWQKVGVEWKGTLRTRLEEKGLLTGEVMREGSVSGKEKDLDSMMDTEREDRQYIVTL